MSDYNSFIDKKLFMNDFVVVVVVIALNSKLLKHFEKIFKILLIESSILYSYLSNTKKYTVKNVNFMLYIASMYLYG